MCERRMPLLAGALIGLLLSASYADIRHVPSETYPTIQSAIDAQGDNITISVANGTYFENLTVHRSVTIQSAHGPSQTSIRFSSGVGIDVTTSGVTIGGTAGLGFTIVQDNPVTSSPCAIQIAATAGMENTVVSHNVINSRGNCQSAISIGAGATHALNLNENEFLLDGNDDAILWSSAGAVTDTVMIADNVFDSAGTTNAVRFERVGVNAATIRGNAIYGHTGSIRLNLGALAMTGITIDGNTLQGAGIICSEPGSGATGARLSQLTITDNLFDADSSSPAFQIENSVEPDDVAWNTVSFRANQVLRSVGGPTAAVDNGIADMGADRLQADRNYWGEPVGPTNAANPLVGAAAAGAQIAGAVTYVPWYATVSTTLSSERYRVNHAGAAIAFADTFGGALRAVGLDPGDTVQLTSTGAQVYPIPAGPQGAQGPSGAACWDRNGNGIADASEDVNHDGVVDVSDCRGTNGTNGTNGRDGVNGIACWDLNGNGRGEPAEDTNGDGNYNVFDCRGAQGVIGTGSGSNGVSCWDLNGNGVGDAGEDTNGDGSFDSLDCRGSDGTGDTSTQNGANGLSCWDLNGNFVADPAEDTNGDGHYDALDCQGPKGEQGETGPAGVGATSAGCGAGLTNTWLALLVSGLVGMKVTARRSAR